MKYKMCFGQNLKKMNAWYKALLFFQNQIPGGACGGEPEKSEATMNQDNSQVMVRGYYFLIILAF